MMRSFAAEWTKVTRPGYLIGFGGVIVGLSLVLTGISVFALTHFGGPAGEPSTALFEQGTGAMLPLIMSSGLLGTTALVLGALATASDYSQGTLRIMLVAHPRRWSFLGGKVLALWAFVTLLVLVAVALEVPLAAAILMAQGADLSAWWTVDALGENLAGLGRVIVSVCSRLLWGVLLATLMRNAAAAIGIGLGYDLILEPILPLLIRDAGTYLPGQVLAAWMNGGTDALPLWGAGALAALYIAAFAAVAILVFERRDVAV